MPFSPITLVPSSLFWKLDTSKIEDIEDIKTILKTLDLGFDTTVFKDPQLVKLLVPPLLPSLQPTLSSSSSELEANPDPELEADPELESKSAFEAELYSVLARLIALRPLLSYSYSYAGEPIGHLKFLIAGLEHCVQNLDVTLPTSVSEDAKIAEVLHDIGNNNPISAHVEDLDLKNLD